MTQSQLEQLRKQIDDLDLELQKLLNQRASLAQEVARVKISEADIAAEGSPVFYRPEREANVLRKVMERNEGPMDDSRMALIFREIMSACLALHKPLEVAYLGPEGTFTEAAALKQFGHSVVMRPVASIADIFSAVERGECGYGVLPVENTTEGVVTHTLDRFMNSPLQICGELMLPINLHLLAQEGVQPQSVRKICAHQQALAQSEDWLQQHYPQVEQLAVSSNGEAAKMAANDPTLAAIAGELAEERYQLCRLASDIQDLADNTTRFLIVSRERVAASGNDKTSLVISTRNEPGALFRLLEPLAREKISMTSLETRPSRTENWAYVFFLEFLGHCDDKKVADVIEELSQQALFVKVLGSYPTAVI